MNKFAVVLLALFGCSVMTSIGATKKPLRHHGRHIAHKTVTKVPKGPLFTFKGGDSYDFQHVRKNEVVTHVFQFRNTGDQTLYIDRVTAPSACVSVKWDVEPILPGMHGSITVTVDSRELVGDFFKEVYILSNAKTPLKGDRYTLYVSGIAETESYKTHDYRVAGW